jgi:hypothetical protein
MATRKHSLLAANRKNMGLIEDAYSETQAFNDPVVQRRKMFEHMADTTKEVYGGWKSIKESAGDYYTGKLDEKARAAGFESYEDWEADESLNVNNDGLDIRYEEPSVEDLRTAFKKPEPYFPPTLTPEEAEALRKKSVGSNPAASNTVISSQGTGPTSYSSTRYTEDLSIFTPTQENVNDLVSFAVTGQGPVSYQSRDERKSLWSMTKDFFQSHKSKEYDPNYEWQTGHGYVYIGEGEEQ